jgi:hypothetical protein
MINRLIQKSNPHFVLLLFCSFWFFTFQFICALECLNLSDVIGYFKSDQNQILREDILDCIDSNSYSIDRAQSSFAFYIVLVVIAFAYFMMFIIFLCKQYCNLLTNNSQKFYFPFVLPSAFNILFSFMRCLSVSKSFSIYQLCGLNDSTFEFNK